MNIFELVSFDFMDWITQPYGIFITAGIVLLLIAIILLLTDKKGGSPKENKADVVENTNVSSTTVQETATVDSVSSSTVVNENVQPVSDAAPMQVEVPSVPVMPVQSSVQVESTVQNVPVQPVIESVVQTPSPVVESTVQIPNVVEPVVQTTSVNITEPSIVAAQQTEPINSFVQNIPEAVTPNDNIQSNSTQHINDVPSVSIYGGVSPSSDIYKINSNEKHEIYGGANPLENTATIPNIQNSIYNGAVTSNDVLQNTQVTTSTVVDLPTAPVDTNVSQMPIEQNNVSVVNSVPVQEPVVNNNVSNVETPIINTVSSSDIEEL